MSFLTLVFQLAFVFIIFSFVFRNKIVFCKKTIDFVSKKSLLLAFMAISGAILGSLFYSEVIGYDPCSLCWVQRAFMFPQIAFLGLALWKKDKNFHLFPLVLAPGGGVVALYQYYGQMFNQSALSCGAGPSCAQRFFVEFSYITIPMMSFTIFALVSVFIILYRKRSQSAA